MSYYGGDGWIMQPVDEARGNGWPLVCLPITAPLFVPGRSCPPMQERTLPLPGVRLQYPQGPPPRVRRVTMAPCAISCMTRRPDVLHEGVAFPFCPPRG